ncbi:hypothetical protein [Plesiocystis pacifica]|uniref:hypothetical protein n=1 Tax=Plesiocystis pacifica TaxID=191768 RepID=UPI0012FBE8E3|nr:hypothetical protein [Plesiocystis pacifica]
MSSSWVRRAVFGVSIGLGLGACKAGDPGVEQPKQGAELEATDEASAARPSEASAPQPSEPPEPGPPAALLLDDPELMATLEGAGLSFAALLHEHPDAVVTADYGAGPLEAIARSVDATIAANKKEDPERTGVGLRYVHRQFDPDWLRAEDTRFELIAVVNRMDRHAFVAADAPDRGERGAMGETRLLYRLAYTREQRGVDVDSRLPMTVNVVYWQPAAASHAEALARWQLDPTLEGAALGEALRAEGAPLSADALSLARLEAVEINVQTERWPATIRPDMAGHAEYLLQVFHRDPEARAGWRAVPLENVPAVDRLRRRDGERAELLAWLLAPEQREALDGGTLVIPPRFSTTASTSVTPRGLARVANRPFSQLFSESDFADYDFEGMAKVRTAKAALRRLDGLSCQGCHESRSIAGFHHLGVERDRAKRVDALAVATSPHLQGELERRAAWTEAVLAGEAGSEVRELSEYERGRGAWGSHCGLGDPGFADWTCDAGLTCRDLGDGELGTCLEERRGTAGGVCEIGTVRSKADHTRDRVRRLPAEDQPRCVSGLICNENAVGFPDGMCTGGCAGAAEDETRACGVIPNLIDFNNCLAAKRPFATCIVETVNPAGMRECSADAPCRDDFICARSPEDELGEDAGACLPPYFLFQLRVDGHPK